MRNYLLASAAAACAFALSAVVTAEPDSADMDVHAEYESDADAVVLTAEQQAEFDSWTDAERQDYLTWPPDYQTYYWGLLADQKRGFWQMTPDQRGRIYNMTPEQQELAWQAAMAHKQGKTAPRPANQANPPGKGVPTTGVPNPQFANQSVQPAMPADESYQGGPYHGALTPPPAAAMNKEYPLCSKTIQDSCINPREAGKNWGNRPLSYWPGKPASEMKN